VQHVQDGLVIPDRRQTPKATWTGNSAEETWPRGVAAGNGSRAVMRGPARQPGRFDRPRRRLRAGLAQLLFALAGLGLGLLLPRVTVEQTVASSRVTEALIGVGFGVLGLVSIIFSLLFLVVQWSFGSLSPRLNLFRDDPIVWRTFGLAVGVFVFSVTAALVIGNNSEVSVIVPAAEVAGVLAAIALIRTLQVKAFASIQLAPTLSAIAAQGRGILDDLYLRPGLDGRLPAAPLPPLRRAEELAAGNFPTIWRHTARADGYRPKA
jgi:uncharacterized membrane protein